MARQVQDGLVPDRRATPRDWTVAMVFCTLVLAGFIASSDEFLHWFVLPVWTAGVLAAVDAARWMRRRLDLFDPRGILGLFGIHFFFIAPLLHVAWDFWLSSVYWGSTLPPPPDWRPYLGEMATLNTAGLLLYRWTANRPQPRRPSRVQWRIVPQRFYVIVILALVASASAQAYVYARMGGISGYIETFSHNREQFQGLGILFTLSETFPILAMFLYAQLAVRRAWMRGWLVLGGVLVMFLVAQLLFGGLRGSRSNTIYGVFWALGIVHFAIRAIPRKAIFIGLPLMFAFMYAYGFYKSYGDRTLEVLSAAEDTGESIADQSGRTSRDTLLGDLGRADVQAFLLYAIPARGDDYHYAMGRSYLGGLALLIPQRLWPGRPDPKMRDGTLVFLGPGSYAPPEHATTKIYGLAGEAILNFGEFAVPFAFLVFGFVVAAVARIPIRAGPGDIRILMYPLLVNVCLVMLTSDSDNVVFTLFKSGLVPWLVLVGAHRATRLSAASRPA